MPSARTGPDQKHALEALWRKWVFPFPVSTDGGITSRLPFPNSARCCCYAATLGSLYRSPVTIIAQIILAILLASATAAILGVRRESSLTSQGRLVPCFGHSGRLPARQPPGAAVDRGRPAW